jgi:hypothetical protein
MEKYKKEKMLDLIIFIYNQYQHNDLNYAKSLISHSYTETVSKLQTAYQNARQDFKQRLLDPIKIPADNVLIDYSAAVEKLTAKKITSIELKKYANNVKIAKEMLNYLHEPLK